MSIVKDDSRTASDKTAADRQTILSNRLHPLSDVMPFDIFVDCAQRLSKECGFDPTTVVKKVPSLDPASVEAVTIKKFKDAEQDCLQINRLYTLGKTEGVILDEAAEVAKKLYPQIAQIGSDLFGEEPRSNPSPIDISSLPISEDGQFIMNYAVEILNRIFHKPFEKSNCIYFGPGSAQVENTKSPQPCIKTLANWSIPNERFDPFEFWDDETALYVLSKTIGASIQPDLILQVPKNEKQNRTIGVGTVAGIAAQHVCGSYVRACLAESGFDLNGLSDIHRRLAFYGSTRKFALATLDLSMASDTISLGLAAALLNSCNSNEHCRTLYYKLLLCRADSYTLNGETFPYHKLSPMGNADTFEVETALFLALITAIGCYYLTCECNADEARAFVKAKGIFSSETRIGRSILDGSSFGDDMILFLPARLLGDPKVQRRIAGFLEEFGLTLNLEKSFFDGDFRESCGADYRDGRLVRGFYHHHRTVTLRDYIRCINYFVIRGEKTLDEIWNLCPEFYDLYRVAGLRRITWDLFDVGYFGSKLGEKPFPFLHEVQIPENYLCDWSYTSGGGRVITYVDKSVSANAHRNYERRKLLAETLMMDDQVQDILMFSHGLRVDGPDVMCEKRFSRILRIVTHLFVTARGEVRDLLIKSCQPKMERVFLIEKPTKVFYQLENLTSTKNFPPKLSRAIYDKINVED